MACPASPSQLGVRAWTLLPILRGATLGDWARRGQKEWGIQLACDSAKTGIPQQTKISCHLGPSGRLRSARENLRPAFPNVPVSRQTLDEERQRLVTFPDKSRKPGPHPGLAHLAPLYRDPLAPICTMTRGKVQVPPCSWKGWSQPSLPSQRGLPSPCDIASFPILWRPWCQGSLFYSIA
jgi:hypothetical protein